MIRSFKLMQDAVVQDCRKPSDSDMRTRSMAYLNEEYFTLMGKILVPQQVEVYTFNTVSGTRTYALPIDFGGVVGLQMVNKAGDTNFSKLFNGNTMQGFINKYPSGVSSTNSEPSNYRIATVNGVKVRSAAAGEAITVASSSALDTAVQATCVAYSNITRDAISRGAINPTTAGAYVSMLDESGAALSVYEAIQIGKSDYSKGTFTFKKGTVVIGSLAPWQMNATFSTIEFAETPDAVYGMRLEYFRQPIGMINDGDVPIGFPPEFCECIEWGAKVRARDFVDDASRVKTAKALYDEKVMELLASHGIAEVETPGFIF